VPGADHHHVALAQEGEQLGQLRPVGLGAGGGIDEHLFAAGLLERVKLQLVVLPRGTDPRVTDQ
jgi:hypothetical protein